MAIEGLKRRAVVLGWMASPNENIVIDGGGAADSGVEGMVEPGRRKKSGKYSDLEGGDATEDGVEGMAEPSHSRKGGKYYDLDDGDSMGAASTAAWRQPSQAATRSSCGGLSPRGPPRCSRCRRPRPPGQEMVKVRVEVCEKGMRKDG